MNKTILVILLVALVLGVALAVVSLPTVSAQKLYVGDPGGCASNTDWDPSQSDDEAYFDCLT